jgi:hypothetical protein
MRPCSVEDEDTHKRIGLHYMGPEGTANHCCNLLCKGSTMQSCLCSRQVQEYLALVRAERHSRLREVLDETDACLRTFAAKLGLDRLLKRSAAGTGSSDAAAASKAAPVPGPSGATTDSLAAVSECWSSLAQALVADIPEQPEMLQGGELREYQMHVSRWPCWCCLC